MKIRKGDRVVVLQGKDRGKEGVVMRAMPKEGKVIVDGVNIARKHQKARKATMQGGIINKDMPIEVSNVAIVGSDGRATRIGYKVNKDGTKVRIDRRTGVEL
ncbi:MAG: 50S ribosomal protein L24 [Acidimicrobiales bacterium]